MNRNLLKRFGDNIWVVEQPSNFLGVPLGLRMTIVRLAKQQLVIHSAIPCNDETEAAIRELGEITHLIVPNLEHTRFIKQWRQRYPSTQLYAPASANLEHSIDLKTISHQTFGDSTLCCLPIDGIPRLDEFAFFHAESKTLILTDLAFNIGDDISLWGKCFLRLNGAYNKFTPSRILKSWVKDNAAFRLSIQQVMQWDFEQIIIAHGEPIIDNAKQAFRQSYKWAL